MLDMLILKTRALEPMHGYGIGVRLERDGLVNAEWRETENNRRAKYYALTPRGRAALEEHTDAWQTQAAAIARILRTTPEEI